MLSRAGACVLLLVCAQTGISEENTDASGVITTEEVVVTATRRQQEALDVPQHVTVITADEIQRSGAANLGDLLKSGSGVSVTGYGPEGSLQSLSLRGSTSSQVLVLVDGLRAPGSHGGADLSMIPLEDVERIEIVRGGASALYGADAVGGVVNIITRKQADGKLRLSFENRGYLPQDALAGTGSAEREEKGSVADLLDTQKLSARYSTRFGDVNLVTSGSLTRAENEFFFTDPTGRKRKRDNAGLLGGHLRTGVNWTKPSGTYDFTAFSLYHRRGVPGDVTSYTPDAEQADLQLAGTFGYRTDRFLSDALTMDLKASYDYYRTDYYDPKNLIDSRHHHHAARVDAFQELLCFDSFILNYGVNLGYERIDSTDLEFRDRVFTGLLVGGELYPGPRVSILPTIRYDYYDDFQGSLNFKLGLVYRVSRTASLKANLAKSYRAPTFNDLYWPKDPFAESNPDLKPETGYSMDAGVSRVGERLSFDLFAFLRYVEDVIAWQPGDDGLWRPTNYNRGLYPGLEVEAEAGLLRFLTLGIHYTFLYTYVLTGGLGLEDDRRIPGQPVHALDGELRYQDRKNTLQGSLGHMSRRYYTVDNNEAAPPATVLDLLYRRRVNENLSVYLAVDNLLNHSYQLVARYPMPGTTIRSGVELEF
jgi:outer membrane receptor for ferrienterochelin and colicins